MDNTITKTVSQMLYFDLHFLLPYPTGGHKLYQYNTKIAALDIYGAIFHAQTVLGIELRDIHGISMYKVKRAQGYTQIHYKRFKLVTDDELVRTFTQYRKYRKNQFKSRI